MTDEFQPVDEEFPSSRPGIVLTGTSGTDSVYHVVEGVAQLTDRSVRELPALEQTIDTDALAALFEPSTDDAVRPLGSISFEYADCQIVVNSDHSVFVQLLE